MQKFFTLNDLDVKGKRVLVRASYDVPLDSSKSILDPKRVKDDSRIVDTLSTLAYLIKNNAKIILQPGWLGRPKGEDPDLSMAPVALRLQELLKGQGLLKHPLLFAPNCLDGSNPRSVYKNKEEVRKIVEKIQEGQIVMLENVRYDPEANSNNQDFAKFIADLAGPDAVYVNEAEAQNHRPEATIISTPRYIVQNGGKAVFGLKYRGVIKYIGSISKLLREKQRGPFIFFLSGKKIETQVGITSKISVTHSLLDKMKKGDTIIVQGAVVYTFLITSEYLDAIGQNKDKIESVISDYNKKIEQETEKINKEKKQNTSQSISDMQTAMQKEKSEKIKDIMGITDNEIRHLVGNSLVEWKEVGEQIAFASRVFFKAKEKNVAIFMNSDHIISNKYPDKYGNLPNNAEMKFFGDPVGIPEGWLGVGPGPKTMESICKKVENSYLLILAGPVQIEDSRLEETYKTNRKLLDAIKKAKENGAVTIAAGGDTVGMVNSMKSADSFTVLSNAGGATLELIEKDGRLPGIDALEENYKRFKR